MKRLYLVLLLVSFWVGVVNAQVVTTTPYLGLSKPCVAGDVGCDPSGHPNWGPILNADWDIVDAKVSFSLDITPPQITANQNNYNPCDTVQTSLCLSTTGSTAFSVVRSSSDASRDITGLAGGWDGRLLIWHNIGAFPEILKDESGLSTATNRFALNADITLAGEQSIVLQYDSTSLRWRAISGVSGAGSSTATAVQVVGGTVGTTTGAIGVNSVAQQLEVAINSLNKVVALTDGNIATATALAANPTDCTVTATNVGVFADTIAANGNLTCKISAVKETRDPTADDDVNDGYVAGLTTWTNTAGAQGARLWRLVDSTAAAAVWDAIDSTTEADTLQTVFARGKIITGANSLVNAARVGDGVTPLCMYTDATYGPVSKPCTDSDRKALIPTDFTWALWDEENNAAVMTADPDATSTGVGTVTMGTGQKFVGSARGINVGSVAGDPSSPANGDIWYDSTANKFNCRENGSSVDCIGGGGATISTLDVFRPAQNEPPAASFATFDTRNSHPILKFADATDSYGIFSSILNRGYAGGNIDVIVHATSTATSGAHRVCVDWERVNTDIDADSFATAQCGSITVSGTSGIPASVTIAFTSAQIDGLAVGEPYRIRVMRDGDGTSGTDDAAGVMELIRVEIKNG